MFQCLSAKSINGKHTVNSKLFAKFRDYKTISKLAKSFRCLMIYVNHAFVANLKRRKYVF